MNTIAKVMPLKIGMCSMWLNDRLCSLDQKFNLCFKDPTKGFK